MDSERGIFEGEGDGTGEMSLRGLVEGVKLTCFFTEGDRWTSFEGVFGRSGRSLLRDRGLLGSGIWVPAATLTGSSENLGCERCRMDLMGLNRASLDRYLLLPSVWGVPRVLVEADRLSEGIMDVLEAFTVAERASDALVGVVTALGKAVKGNFAAVVGFSSLLSREKGRVWEASSSRLRLTLFPGVASALSGFGSVLKDFDRGMPVSTLSKPALELLRLREDEVVGAVALLCIFVFHVEM